MTFTRARPGGWAFGEVLTSDQMNQLDIDHVGSLDGSSASGGGTYSPLGRLTWRHAWTFDGDNLPVPGTEDMVRIEGSTTFNSASDAGSGIVALAPSNLGPGTGGGNLLTAGNSISGAGGVGATITGGD